MVRCGTLCAVKITGSSACPLGAGRVTSRTMIFGESLDQQRMVVPDSRRNRWRTEPLLLGKRLLVESNAGARILRRQADRHRVLDAIRVHLRQGIGDERLPVAHADISGKPDFALQPSAARWYSRSVES